MNSIIYIFFQYVSLLTTYFCCISIVSLMAMKEISRDCQSMCVNICYLHQGLASEGIVMLGITLSCFMCVSLCLPSHGEGIVLRVESFWF